jgi:hypothetical protein
MGAPGPSCAAPRRRAPDLPGRSCRWPPALLIPPHTLAQIRRWRPNLLPRSRRSLPIWRHIPTSRDLRRRPNRTTVLSAGGRAWKHEPPSSFRETMGRSSLGGGGGAFCKIIGFQTACSRPLYMPLGHVQPTDGGSSAEPQTAHTDKYTDYSYNP